MTKANRRIFVKNAGLATLGLGLSPSLLMQSCGPNKGSDAATATLDTSAPLFFGISLAQWSLHNSFFGDALKGGWQEFGNALRNDPSSLYRGPIKPIDFPSITRNNYGIEAIELVNTFYYDKAKDSSFLADFAQRCSDNDVKVLLIMCDALGDLGNLDDAERTLAVQNHYQWVDAAKFLGCHSIRVNAAGRGTAEEVMNAAVDGLGQLSEYGASVGINIIVENHGGYSSDGKWLAEVMRQVNNPVCGTLPDFGNFCMEYGQDGCAKEYDRYIGVEELMPFAKGVSAKTNVFDAEGNEAKIDYTKMLKIVKDAGYTGYIGIEYEGNALSEDEGIKATKALLEKVGRQIG